MEEKMNILQLAPRFPFPADDGGKIGIANILKEFSNQGADVTFFCFYDNGINAVSKEALSEGEKYADIYLMKHSTKNSVPRIISSVINNHSIYIHKHTGRKILRELSALLRKKKFDVVHADHTCMAGLALFAKEIQNIPAGLRLHNIEWLIWQRYAETLVKSNPKRFYVSKQAEILRKSEKEIYKKMDVCFAITEPDRQRAIELSPDSNVVVASAGVVPEEWKPDNNIKRDPNELILATAFNWVHNVDAIKWFLSEVLPYLKNKNEKIKLKLIGKNMPEWLSDYKDSAVEVVGYVDRVQPYLNQAGIYIAPLFVGGGIRIKILEAMAMELPVVASPVAAEGINAGRDQGLFISNNKDEFCENIIELCRNPEKALLYGKSAREFVIREYSWKKNVGIMLDEYRNLINSR
jgi:glycosyltransferase involved in cell wall biosynthesis